MPRLLLFILGLSAFQLSAQDAFFQSLADTLEEVYGAEVQGWAVSPQHPALLEGITYYGATAAVQAVTGPPFEEALSLQVPQGGADPWSAGALLTNEFALQAGDVCLLIAWVKTDEAGSARFNWFVEDASTYAKEAYLSIHLTEPGTWHPLYFPFIIEDSYPPGTLNLGLHLGLQAQELQLAGLNIARLAAGIDPGDLPHQLFNENYPGSAPDAPWRAAAAERINDHRKANLKVQVTTAEGSPVPSANVHFEMREHQFGFGSAVVTCMVNEGICQDDTYQARLLDLDGQGHRFNCLVNENSLKWKAWENNWLGTPAQTYSALSWLKGEGFKIRGHNIIWPGFDYMPGDIAQNAGNPDYVHNRILEHIEEKVGYPGLSSLLTDWDVLNEITANRDLEYIFQGAEGYETGREIYPEIIARVMEAAPNSQLYLNDYVTISSATTHGATYDRYQQFIRDILDAGAPVAGIGFQAHMGSGLYHPDTIYAILDDFYAQFGLPAKITEFDQSETLSEALAARYFRDFLTLVFSHPSVNAFLMWGFWDGAHWKSNAPLFREDWTPKPALDTFVQLVFEDWWTDETLPTQADGTAAVNGFKGQYRVSVTYQEESIDTLITLEEDRVLTIRLATTLDAQRAAAPALQVYPNPAVSQLTVEWLSAPEDAAITVFDAQGRAIQRLKRIKPTQHIQTAGWPPGAYTLRFEAAGQSWAQQVTVQH